METQSIGFIGGGRITKVFLQGFKNKNVKFTSIKVFDTDADVLSNLKISFPDIEIAELLIDIFTQNVVFIALHPPVIKEIIGQLKDRVVKTTLISLAPKFTIAKIAELTGNQRVVRIIPNATSFINEGYNPICFSNRFDNDEKSSILELFKKLGPTFETEENKLEAYAICSAMLPTYFWFQWKEMEEIAGKIGLSDEEAKDAIYNTLRASLNLMYKSDLKYDDITDLIPIKPIGANEPEIKEVLSSNLTALYSKIKP
nr:NAD(P)-binding domain-containing protein [uncultured Carboxylicivirga sp.]